MDKSIRICDLFFFFFKKKGKIPQNNESLRMSGLKYITVMLVLSIKCLEHNIVLLKTSIYMLF